MQMCFLMWLYTPDYSLRYTQEGRRKSPTKRQSPKSIYLLLYVHVNYSSFLSFGHLPKGKKLVIYIYLLICKNLYFPIINYSSFFPSGRRKMGLQVSYCIFKLTTSVFVILKQIKTCATWR